MAERPLYAASLPVLCPKHRTGRRPRDAATTRNAGTARRCYGGAALSIALLLVLCWRRSRQLGLFLRAAPEAQNRERPARYSGYGNAGTASRCYGGAALSIALLLVLCWRRSRQLGLFLQAAPVPFPSGCARSTELGVARAMRLVRPSMLTHARPLFALFTCGKSTADFHAIKQMSWNMKEAFEAASFVRMDLPSVNSRICKPLWIFRITMMLP